MPSFPDYRPRRLRRSAALRSLVRETLLAPSQLVLPLFVRPGTGVRQPVASMPGVSQTSVDELLKDAHAAAALGIGGVLHGMIASLDGSRVVRGSIALDPNDPALSGIRLANQLRGEGASEILEGLRRAQHLPSPQPE